MLSHYSWKIWYKTVSNIAFDKEIKVYIFFSVFVRSCTLHQYCHCYRCQTPYLQGKCIVHCNGLYRLNGYGWKKDVKVVVILRRVVYVCKTQHVLEMSWHYRFRQNHPIFSIPAIKINRWVCMRLHADLLVSGYTANCYTCIDSAN